ncbi:MAG: phage protease [bacterium]
MSGEHEYFTVIMDASPEAPGEFLIFPFGTVTGTGMEPFTVDAASIESVRADHQAKGRDGVIDYEHQTLTGGIAPAAGWIKGFFNNGSGLACRVDWTEKAKEFIKNREYRYFSPVVGLDKKRHLVNIQSIALTNLPKGHNLTPLVMKALEAQSSASSNQPFETRAVSSGLAKDAGANDIKKSGEGDHDSFTGKEEGMKEFLTLLGLPEGTSKEKAIEVMSARMHIAAGHEALKSQLATALNVSSTATSQEVMGAINALKEASSTVACQEVMSELGLSAAASKSDAIATIRALKQTQVTGISVAEFQAMKEKLAQRDANDLVTEAMKAGKITAAQKEWATEYAKADPAGFKVFVEKAPVVVTMKEIGGAGPDQPPAKEQITETDRIVMKQMGISEEEFKEFLAQKIVG